VIVVHRQVSNFATVVKQDQATFNVMFVVISVLY